MQKSMQRSSSAKQKQSWKVNSESTNRVAGFPMQPSNDVKQAGQRGSNHVHSGLPSFQRGFASAFMHGLLPDHAIYIFFCNGCWCLQAKAAQQIVDHVLESGGVCISCQHRSCLELKQQEPTIRYAPECCGCQQPSLVAGCKSASSCTTADS